MGYTAKSKVMVSNWVLTAALENVETSKRDIPAGFKMPEKAETKPPPKEDLDDDFWCESDEESFGEDSDGDMEFG